MIRAIRNLPLNTSAMSSAEFAMVLPLLLIFLFGMIDTGRFLWEFNEAEKATQVGARMAIVTNVLSSGLRDEDYAGKTFSGKVLKPGDRIPAAALDTMVCDSTGCECPNGNGACPDPGTFDSATFSTLVTRMKQIYPGIESENVEVRYSGSGFGTAATPSAGGGPEVMEISPLVTVSLKDMQFRPITTFLFATINMPTFSTTLSSEDASGTFSN